MVTTKPHTPKISVYFWKSNMVELSNIRFTICHVYLTCCRAGGTITMSSKLYKENEHERKHPTLFQC